VEIDFHEHMLFLGTEKYPNEDEYETFLSQYGGFSNAYTDMEDTNYYFSITTDAEECFTADSPTAATATTTAPVKMVDLDPTTTHDGSNVAVATEIKETIPIQCTEALYGAMDRLAQFFVAPKFDRDMVDRELRAIDSEYRNGITNDAWRNFQLLKLASNQSHPISKFGCGNYDTLMSMGIDELLDQLQQFWNNYYQTYNLRLAVVGHGSLDALQRMVEETFGQLPYSEGEPRRIQNRPDQFFQRENAVYDGTTAYGPNQLGILRHIIPITETRTIQLMFATPPLDDPAIQSSKPYRALSHFLGHESPGSLHALLNEDGLLTSLSSGLSLDTSDFSLFSLTIGLTPKGMKVKDHVLDLVFHWIALLREPDLEQRAAYHDELRQISDVSFRFRENDDPTDFCSSAAEQLFEDGLDPARVLIASNEASAYDPAVEDEFLNRLRPDNCMIHIIDSDLDLTMQVENSDDDDDDQSKRGWQTEPWYGAKYIQQRLSLEQMNKWASPDPISRDVRLYAPALNAYIPTDFSLRCDDGQSSIHSTSSSSVSLDGEEGEHAAESAVTAIVSHEDLMFVPPKVVLDRPNIRLWHKTDQYWRVPKAFVKTAILSPSTYQSPRSMTLNRIFQRVLNDDLNSYVYDASQAGCNYRVSCTPNGYRISVKGYSEKVPFLLDALTSRMLSLIGQMKDGDTKLRDKFEKGLEGLLRETRNYRLDAPHEVANYNSRLLIEQDVWYLDSYLAVMEGDAAKENPLTMEECAKAAEESLMGRIKCETLCMGNMNENEARDVANVLDRHFLHQAQTLSDVEIPRFRSMVLPTRDEAIRMLGPETFTNRSVPIVYQELALTDTEENNAVEYILQAGCEFDLGYEGLAILDLITHMAYNSAFNMLRTKEQLGYIVSAHARKTAGGAWGMSIVIQSSVAVPEILEERCEAWLLTYRKELEEMTPESMAQEASAVVAQLLETDTKMSQEVGRVWGEILNTEGLTDDLCTPEFNRVQYLADELIVADDSSDAHLTLRTGSHRRTAAELKQHVLDFYDEHFAVSSPQRRGMSSRVYCHASKDAFQSALQQPGVFSSYADMRYVKQLLRTYPNVPYWCQRVSLPVNNMDHDTKSSTGIYDPSSP
jgi:insulysin